MKIMNKVLLSLTVVFTLAVDADQSFRADQSFGAPMPATGNAISLKQAIADIGSHVLGEMIKVQGQVTEVCQAKGCWMILVDGDSYARITFEDYGFFVPIETSMQRSIVFGVLTEHTLSGEQAEHYAQDAGAKSTLKAKGEVREYSLIARAVQLQSKS
jgi:hypothetical protein